MSKVALITGCSSGIGLSTAVLLGEAGWSVVPTMRNLAKAEPLERRAADAGVPIDLRVLDVTDAASIERCVSDVVEAHGSIDLLVNNAGFGALGSVEQMSPEVLAGVMDANFFGVWNLTRAVLPGMRERGSGRIISVTSVGGLLGQPFNEAYCAAKFAVEGMMEGLAPIARQFGVHVSLIEPGPVNTEFVATVRSTVEETMDRSIPGYAELLGNYMAATRGVFETLGQTPDEIAEIIVEAAAADAPHLRYLTSDFVRASVLRKTDDPTGDAVVELFAERLAGA